MKQENISEDLRVTNVYIFNTMVEGHPKEGMWRMALKLSNEAVDSDTTDVFTYNILIYHLTKCKGKKKASELRKKIE